MRNTVMIAQGQRGSSEGLNFAGSDRAHVALVAARTAVMWSECKFRGSRQA